VEKALALHRKAALAESPRKSKIVSTKYAAAIVSACRAGIENAEKFMPRTPYEAGEPAKANVRKVMAEVIAIEDSL
jgi:4-hydroxy-2-oxoglutarate aldolase